MEPLRSYTSRHLGVRRKRMRYQAQVTRNRVTYNLGTFDDEEDAARAYNAKVLELDGPGARLNDVSGACLQRAEEASTEHERIQGQRVQMIGAPVDGNEISR